MKTIDLDAESAYVDRLRDIWLAERDALTRLVLECAASKTTPPTNYWEKEHRARGRFLLAAHVFNVMSE